MPDRTPYGNEQGASMPPQKPKIRKRLKSILMSLKKQKKPTEILGIPTRVTLKKGK
tara:strand:+ start:3221 stop:3388 length:168 start_codon:yes stop_codon:yes gene_type:complete